MTGALTVRALQARLVRVPMRRVLHTGGGQVREAPLLLLDLHTDEGPTGRAYLFCYQEAVGRATAVLAEAVGELLAGTSAHPADVRSRLGAHFRLAGVTGPVASVLAGVDVACWDALAIAADLPLVRLLGALPRPVPAYNSNGCGLLAADAVAAEAVQLIGEGFAAVKVRLGRPRLDDDVAAVRAVRRALPDDVAVMADFNQVLSPSTVDATCHRLDGEGLAWIEEPVRHDDYATTARLRPELRTPLQIGENFAGPHAMAGALAAGASDLVMPDLDRIGGVTGWLHAAALAAAASVPMSSHLYPEVSAHLLAVTPTAHWLEYVDWAVPVLAEPLSIEAGAAVVPDRPGTGVVWDEEAVARYRIG